MVCETLRGREFGGGGYSAKEPASATVLIPSINKKMQAYERRESSVDVQGKRLGRLQVPRYVFAEEQQAGEVGVATARNLPRPSASAKRHVRPPPFWRP
jgi:hypothetical protein